MSLPTSDNLSQNGVKSPSKERAGLPPKSGETIANMPACNPTSKQWMRLVVLGLVALITVAVLASGFTWGYYRWQHTIVDHAMVKGRVYQIGSRLDGQVKTMEVESGQQVVKGQVLIRLEDDHFAAAARAAQAQLQAATKRLEVEKLSITQAREQLALDVERAESGCGAMVGNLEAATSTRRMYEGDCERAMTLFKLGIDCSSNLDFFVAQRDHARALVKVAQADLNSAQSDCRLARVKLEGLKVQEAGLEVLAANVELARQQLALSEADEAATVIRAPADGWVIDRIVEPGGSAKVGEPMISLWLGPPWVEAWVNEKKLGHIQIGSPADVTLMAFPGRKLHGQVEAIGVLTDTALQAETTTEAKSVPDTLHSFFIPDSMVPVRIAISESPVRLQPGLTALVGIRDGAPTAETSAQRVARGPNLREPSHSQFAGRPPAEFHEQVKLEQQTK